MIQRLRVVQWDYTIVTSPLGRGRANIQRKVFEVDNESYDKALPGCMKS
jgi:hypothetical protein